MSRVVAFVRGSWMADFFQHVEGIDHRLPLDPAALVDAFDDCGWNSSNPVVSRQPFCGTAVATSAALAFNDAATTGKLHVQTRQALDRMWTLQRDDGGWNWLKCGWPPMESDDHYGATLAAIAAGVAPEGYAKTDAARQGLEKLRQYLKKNPSPTLHHQAMTLWAATLVDGLLTDAEKQATADKLWSLQKPDGGWALATLGDWQRADKGTQDTEHSDGYGTGFVVFVLRRAGTPANDPRVQKAVAWLKANQRESGRWITRSLNKDNHHFISHAGTAFAVMALKACDGS